MKLGDRVIILGMFSPNFRDEPGTIAAMPYKEHPGLIVLDAPVGHNADVEHVGTAEFFRELRRQVREHDITMIDDVLPPRSQRRLWWFYGVHELRSLAPETSHVAKSVDPLSHVPGRHHCSNGCGDINEYASARSFVGGQYVCYSCRNVWNPKTR